MDLLILMANQNVNTILSQEVYESRSLYFDRLIDWLI